MFLLCWPIITQHSIYAHNTPAKIQIQISRQNSNLTPDVLEGVREYKFEKRIKYSPNRMTSNDIDTTNPASAYKCWCFTLNNPEPGDGDLLRGLSPAIASYLIYGSEHFAPGKSFPDRSAVVSLRPGAPP